LVTFLLSSRRDPRAHQMLSRSLGSSRCRRPARGVTVARHDPGGIVEHERPNSSAPAGLIQLLQAPDGPDQQVVHLGEIVFRTDEWKIAASSSICPRPTPSSPIPPP
jgi:hypothetical protein